MSQNPAPADIASSEAQPTEEYAPVSYFHFSTSCAPHSFTAAHSAFILKLPSLPPTWSVYVSCRKCHVAYCGFLAVPPASFSCVTPVAQPLGISTIHPALILEYLEGRMGYACFRIPYPLLLLVSQYGTSPSIIPDISITQPLGCISRHSHSIITPQSLILGDQPSRRNYACIRNSIYVFS
jgi:hypothetical protein